jgi:hypothetical protein
LIDLKKRGRPKKCIKDEILQSINVSKKSTGFSDWQVRSHVLSSFGKLDSAKQCNFGGCIHRFHNGKGMARHFLKEHMGMEIHNCRFCEKSFLNPNARDNHMKLYHESDLI